MAIAAHPCPDQEPRPRFAWSPLPPRPPLGGWPSVLTDDGLIPLADDASGSVVSIPLFDGPRVRSGLICGFTGSGKTVSARSVLLPGVVAGLETLLVVDGHRGMAFPDLRPVVSRYARMPEQWSLLIELAHWVMVARLDRRGAAGLPGWDVPGESDPIVTLVLDEVPTLRRKLSSRHLALVCDLIENGGLVGIRVIQITQSLHGEDVIGGPRVRDLLLASGWVICHRVREADVSRLSDVVSGNPRSVGDVSLRGLAYADAGEAAVVHGGALAGFPISVRLVGSDRVKAALTSVAARHLAGDDLAAVGPEYTAAHWDDCWTPGYVFESDRS